MVHCLWLGVLDQRPLLLSCAFSTPQRQAVWSAELLLLEQALRHGASRQGRGGSTGYDNAVALPARADAEELAKENLKSTVALKGQAVFSVAKVGSLCLTCVLMQACLPCVVAAPPVE